MSTWKQCPFCKLQVAGTRDECPKCRHLFMAAVSNLRGVGSGKPYGNKRVLDEVVRVVMIPIVALLNYLFARTREAEDFLERRVKRW